MSSKGTIRRRREKRARRQARRVDKQKPLKGFFMRLLRKTSRAIFGKNIFKRWTDSPLQPPGTKPNPAYNATEAGQGAGADSSAPQATS